MYGGLETALMLVHRDLHPLWFQRPSRGVSGGEDGMAIGVDEGSGRHFSTAAGIWRGNMCTPGGWGGKGAPPPPQAPPPPARPLLLRIWAPWVWDQPSETAPQPSAAVEWPGRGQGRSGHGVAGVCAGVSLSLIVMRGRKGPGIPPRVR